MKRIYYNTNTGRTAELDTSRAAIIYKDTQTRRNYKSNQNAAHDIRAHGYKLICIKA